VTKIIQIDLVMESSSELSTLDIGRVSIASKVLLEKTANLRNAIQSFQTALREMRQNIPNACRIVYQVEIDETGTVMNSM